MDTSKNESSPEQGVTAKSDTIRDLSKAHENASTDADDSKSEIPSQQTTKDLLAVIHQFTSTTSNETLLGICIGSVACIYLILGSLGLVLIGVAGGFILHASWEDDLPINDVRIARRERSLDILSRVLDWRENQAKIRGESGVDQTEELMITGEDFEGLPTEIGAALTSLVETIINDYVKWWYTPIISTEEAFPVACRHTMTAFLRSIATHLSRKRPADTFLDILTNSSSILIVFLNELSNAIGTPQTTSDSTADAINIYLSSRPESSLAILVNHYQQKKKFKMVAEDILQNFLDKPIYDCFQVRIFLKEIIASVILEMSLSACSKPEWINGWIVYILENTEPELSQGINVDMGSMSSDDLEIGLENAVGTEQRKHQKRLSKAEEAMEEAMREAKRLSQLIAESDERRAKGLELSITGEISSSQRDELPVAEEPQAKDLQLTNNYGTGNPTLISTKEPTIVNPEKVPAPSFTSFDQIIPPAQVTALQSEPQRPRRQTASLSLFNANIIIHDDFMANDKNRISGKPTADYLIQIEPESSQYPGWMIVRRYPDFEVLHEVLRRIAKIAGVQAFTEQHSILPSWKTHTRSSLRGELERYLRDACWQQPLADCEGMRHFLEKDQSNMQVTSTKGISWPKPAAFENMGKGVLDVLTNAPKGAAGGSKALLGGVSGVLGNISSLGQKKRANLNNNGFAATGKVSLSTLQRQESANSSHLAHSSMEIEGSRRLLPISQNQTIKVPFVEPKLANTASAENEFKSEWKSQMVSLSHLSSLGGQNACSSTDLSQTSLGKVDQSIPAQVIDAENDALQLPSEFLDTSASLTEDFTRGYSRSEFLANDIRPSTSDIPAIQSSSSIIPATGPTPPKKSRKEAAPLTEQETRVVIELLFASISELYTLSSAWKFRRTLLMAGKAFLLRPGNPSLTSIQALIQDSIIAPNVSDSGIAAHLHRLRENVMSAEKDRKGLIPEMTSDEKEMLRIKARKLLLEKGLPSALTGVMGQAATSEALGRLFDCLQAEEIARGLMFGVLLQGIQGLIH